MAKLKKTKSELKTQRDALRRFTRYLPTLELKKQQLRMELRRIDAAVRNKRAERRKAQENLDRWVRVFADAVDVGVLIRLAEVRKAQGNVAGVNVPVLEGVLFERSPVDLFATPPWVDDALDMLEVVIRLEIEEAILLEQRRLIGEELRITSQRVNLFEKVKIPQSRENIRRIRISLGDAQTASVARAKLAKSKGREMVEATT